MAGKSFRDKGNNHTLPHYDWSLFLHERVGKPHFRKWKEKKKKSETKEELITGKRIKRVINSTCQYTCWN